ncbi:MAG: hypothetical protein AAGU11_05090 [Syntrophobacteraceae bacterium]
MKSSELAFFGKIAAGVTHELKNVLAIINESNGLMGDLLGMVKDSPFPHRDRFQRSIGRIEEQVRRGVEITSRFNQFSHSMDRERAEIDLNEVVARTIALSERFARLSNLDLRGIPSATPVAFVTNPFKLQMVLTRAIEACMAGMAGKGSISLMVREEQDTPCIELECRVEDGGTVDLLEAFAKKPELIDFQEIAAEVEIDTARVLRTGFTLLFRAGSLHLAGAQ